MAKPFSLADRPVEYAQFESFVRSNGDRLLHTAYELCGDWQHAEDLVQSVLVRVAARWDTITTDPLAYAYRGLVRANIDRWRVHRRRLELLVDPTTTPTLEPPPADHTADHTAVLTALHAMPARQRAIIVLRYLQDLSESQTADALGISVGAVKSGASRGLARLRTEMNSTPEVAP